ncbi:MAG: hypothetical protein IPG16_01810 [Comamonadaceae bacterium]|nr:hypothetical protein [Comamonadaceae bacterium]
MNDSPEIVEWFLLITGKTKSGKTFVNIIGGYPSQKDGKNAAKRFRRTPDFEFFVRKSDLALHVRPLYLFDKEI